MNIPFNHLDVLESKPIPKQMEQIKIGIKNDNIEEVKNDNIEEIKNDNIEEIKNDNIEEIKNDNIEEETNLVKNITHNQKTKILDKRKTSNLNREEILNNLRIRGESSVSVLYNTEQEKNIPIVTNKQVVIKPKPIIVDNSNEERKRERVEETKEGIPEELLEDMIEETKKESIAEEMIEETKKEGIPEEMIEETKEGIPEKMVEETKENDIDLISTLIKGQNIIDRLPSDKEKIIIKAPTYYMNNRKIFTQKLTELFKPYRDEIKDNQNNISCDDKINTDFDLLTHQKIVRDYLNLYSPYRGLLLYHGLGSGKTCSSIALAEGMKSDKQIFVLTPASLKMNFFSEMKKCGDELYKKNQFWEFISIEGKPDYILILAKALSIPIEYIKKQKGAWLVNIKKEPNFTLLDSIEQQNIDDQINIMIRSKYRDLNYNGLDKKKVDILTENNTINPFDNSVVIIDEAHNFVSRVVNKISNVDNFNSILYENLMNATNARIILLTGTPIINYPYEIGILYNLLRGYVKSWSIPITWDKAEKLNLDTILSILDKGNLNTYDYINFTDNKLQVTRNPFGFINVKKRGALKGTKRKIKGGKSKTKKINIKLVEKLTFDEEEIEPSATMEYYTNKGFNGEFDLHKGGNNVLNRYNGIKLDQSGNIDDDQFLKLLLKILKNKNNNIKINEKNIIETKYKCLPDKSDEFINYFIDVEKGMSKNLKLFQRRILGLTSYFRSAQEELLPSYVKTDNDDIYHIVKCEMSDHQFSDYSEIRHDERENESKSRKAKARFGNELFTISSTYRIFSRACCNFSFPTEIKRPKPPRKINQEVNEDTIDKLTEQPDYNEEILKTMAALDSETDGIKTYLNKDALQSYSPKFRKILDNISSVENIGLHLLYSHFRTLEGIGIIRLILLANGFSEFKIQKQNNNWTIIEDEDELDKPKFVLYTGSESAEEKEIIRNVYNSNWEYVPISISNKLLEKAKDNNLGEIIKLLMITSSGAEGINLKSTRFVHIVEPYWHMVRIEQVVGRARRICSHQSLPEDMRNVKVFLYASVLSNEQKKDKNNNELINQDISKIDNKTTVTTDESLYEISSIKQKINNQFLNAIKESAIDCNIHSNNSKKDETLICYNNGKVESNQFSSYPSLQVDSTVKDNLDIKEITWTGVKITYKNNKDYVINPNTNEVYNYDSYLDATTNNGQLVLEGHIVDGDIEFI